MRPALVVALVLACGDDEALTRRDAAAPADAAARPDAPAVVDLCDGVTPVPGTPPLAAELVASVMFPTDLEAPPQDVRRLFVATMDGTIRVIDLDTDTLLEAPFLDLSGRVDFDGNEAGLLGLALHPRYAENGRLFVYYSDLFAQNVIVEFHASAADPDRAQPTPDAQIFAMPTEQDNHNGGGMEFGPDGLLYVGSGDGGSGGDPDGDSRMPDSPLGKLLRFDVDAPEPYVPAGNPYAAGGGHPAVFAYGFRNPWRLGLDRLTGDLYVADVGQGAWEEVTVAPAPDRGLGRDFGWNQCEGDSNFAGSCNDDLDPTLVYSHAEGQAVIGGYVYRGCRMPGWDGTYFYGDHDVGWVRSFVYAGGAATSPLEHSGLDQGPQSLSSFGLDTRGELYLADFGDGLILRVGPE
jgi:glucose/arabinose dehydrogenase